MLEHSQDCSHVHHRLGSPSTQVEQTGLTHRKGVAENEFLSTERHYCLAVKTREPGIRAPGFLISGCVGYYS